MFETLTLTHPGSSLILVVSCPAVIVQRYAVVGTGDCDCTQNAKAPGNCDVQRDLEEEQGEAAIK
jgi:hypothetical protein